MICIYSRSLPPFTAAYRRSFVQQAHLSPQLMIYDRCARRRRQCGAVRGEDGARNGRVSTVRAITAARRCVEVRGRARHDSSGERRCGARRCGGSRTSVRENAGSCGSHINLFDRPLPPADIQIPPAPQHNTSGPAGPAGVRSRCRSLVHTGRGQTRVWCRPT